MGVGREKYGFRVAVRTCSERDEGSKTVEGRVVYHRFFNIFQWSGKCPDYDMNPVIEGMCAEEVGVLRDKLTEALEK